MQIVAGGCSVAFQFDEDREAYVAEFTLPVWAEFKSENTNPDYAGASVLLMLEPEVPGSEEHADAACYERGISWLLAHQQEVKESALSGIAGWIHTLRGEYGIHDDELDRFSSLEQLTTMIDLSYVRIYPQAKDGKPYFGLEFECNWDPEHGCGVMFHGTRVVEVGVSDSVQGSFDIAADGGGV